VAVGYDRRINTAGALGVVADSQTIFTNVTLIKLAKGLSVEVSPYYRILKSPDNSVDIRAYGVPVQATWQFTPWFGVTAGYIFFHQRSDSTVVNTVTGAPLATDVDQNRVYFGFLFGYPIKFD
jgi:outer membrane receptor protein involved in Fe transport